MKYLIGIREIHVSEYEIEADTVENALARIADGEGRYMSTEYSHTLDDSISYARVEK